MNAVSIKEVYETKTDDELLSLASQKDTLIETARNSLMGELRRRGLDDSPAMAIAGTTVKADSETEQKTYQGQSSFVLLGLFLLNTFVVYGCAVRLSPFLVGRWFAWVTPVAGVPTGILPTDWYLQHLELVTIIPALVAGYIDLGRFLPVLVGKEIGQWRSGSAAMWAWIIPCAVLLHGMLIFHAPSSVLVGSSMSAFKYFFKIQTVMPTFKNLTSDPTRVLDQMIVTAPFYASVAYSLGAFAWRHRLLRTIFTHNNAQPFPPNSDTIAAP